MMFMIKKIVNLRDGLKTKQHNGMFERAVASEWVPIHLSVRAGVIYTPAPQTKKIRIWDHFDLIISSRLNLC